MKFTATAMMTISVTTEVEANSPDEALSIALNKDVKRLCHSCAGGDRSTEWITSGELDGEPFDIELTEEP